VAASAFLKPQQGSTARARRNSVGKKGSGWLFRKVVPALLRASDPCGLYWGLSIRSFDLLGRRRRLMILSTEERWGKKKDVLKKVWIWGVRYLVL